MGAWIEIKTNTRLSEVEIVAPHMGAWIEISLICPSLSSTTVAPHMGAWIEIVTRRTCYAIAWSHPTWVRGLK